MCMHIFFEQAKSGLLLVAKVNGFVLRLRDRVHLKCNRLDLKLRIIIYNEVWIKWAEN